MTNQDIMPNQEQTFIHVKLADDLAYQYSVRVYSVWNMRLVLRAHGEAHNDDAAIKQLEVAASLNGIAA